MLNNENVNCNIYGIISSSHRGTEIRPYEKQLQNHFQNNGGIVCIFSKENGEEPLEYLDKIFETNIKEFYNKNRIIFICRENFLIGDAIDGKAFENAIKEGLSKLKKSGFKENCVYITIDSFWDNFLWEDRDICYDFLKEASYSEDIKIIFRYIMEELSEKYIHNLFKYHKLLMVDGIEDFEICTSEELMCRSMRLLSKHNFLVHNFEKEMVRLEYLKTLGELMEGTVHDMNNLLITILGYAQLAMITKDRESTGKSLKIIESTALDGKIIIDRLQHHMRGSTNSLKSLYEFDNIIKTSIEMTEHKFKPCALGRKGQLKLIVDLNSNKYIYGNEYELRQSIVNIILNGVDAMEEGGTMTIKTYDNGEQTVLEIADTGHGMDEITVAKLFDPYFSTKGNNGTGLGLNIAKKVFDKHDAEVKVESKIGKGTKFLIYFPTEVAIQNIAEIRSKDYNIS